MAKTTPSSERLLIDIRALIESTRARVAQTVNAGLVLLYWSIGNRINRELLHGDRAAYGGKIIRTLSDTLTPQYGQGFGHRNLFRMVAFSTLFPNPKIVSTLSTQLGWSHFLEILQFKDSNRREFYTEMCRIERWSVRALRQKIRGLLFERTALSKKPAKLIELELTRLRREDVLAPDLVFRDPYLLDFLGLKDAYSESDLESAILRELERFLVEFGNGFAFVARQKRITLDGEDYYIDLLFYHRGMRRLVAVELKLDRFKAADKGQMELYLRWLDRYERRPGEDSPIGLILCAGKSAEQVELLELEKSGIRVAEYLTALPPKETLEKKLRDALLMARAKSLGRSPS